MPIYAYRCESCGHAKDVLQKMSDPLLTVCPACGQPTFKKQVTAAGFQLKGSGWYVTDFRGDNKTGAPAESKDAKGGEAAKPAAEGAKAPAAAGDGASAAPAPAPAPAAAKPAASPTAPSPSSSSGTGSGGGTGAGSQ